MDKKKSIYLHNLKECEHFFKGFKPMAMDALDKKKCEELSSPLSPTKNPNQIDFNLATSSTLCQTCMYTFVSREDQIFHYQSDWHRYNLKTSLLDHPAITLNVFENIVEDLSSISGSDSDYSEDNLDIKKSIKIESLFHENGMDVSQSKNIEEDDHMKKEEIINRSPYVYFLNSASSILGVYKVILPKTCNTGNNYSTIENFLFDVSNKTCIILFNAGHFAASVFKNGSPVIHKTFHKYVVRAKRGTVQSQRDQKGSAPKSGGASLRRHNESELAKNIQLLIQAWKEHLETSNYIFIRSPKYNKEIFYGGKNPLFKKDDERIHGIPFITKRPTFNETKRVYQELFSVAIFDENFPLSVTSNKINTASSPSPIKVISPQKKEKKSPIVEKISNDVNNSYQADEQTDKAKKKHAKSSVKQNVEIVNPTSNQETPELKHYTIIDDLYTICKTGDVDGLLETLSSLSVKEKDTVGENLNISLDDSGNTVLHIAARSGKTNIILELLKAGCDPGTKNELHQTAYSVSCDKLTRNAFRKFMAEFPEKYDYVRANIPGPLTDDMEAEIKAKQNEKKKVKRQQRKEKLKTKAIENETKKIEKEARDKYTSMSDREKRALAAEKRLANMAKEKGAVSTLSAERCWKCGESLLGQMPFEYSSYKFCSIKCLKLHKGLIKE